MAAEAITIGPAASDSPRPPAGARARLRTVLTVTQVGLGLLLVWASLGKIAHPHEFASTVYAYGLVNANASLLIAALLPWIELLTGLCLIVGVHADAALLVALVLFTMFACIVGYALATGLDVSCGCFGQSDDGKVTGLTLARNLMLVFAAGAAMFLHLRLTSRKEAASES